MNTDENVVCGDTLLVCVQSVCLCSFLSARARPAPSRAPHCSTNSDAIGWRARFARAGDRSRSARTRDRHWSRSPRWRSSFRPPFILAYRTLRRPDRADIRSPTHPAVATYIVGANRDLDDPREAFPRVAQVSAIAKCQRAARRAGGVKGGGAAERSEGTLGRRLHAVLSSKGDGRRGHRSSPHRLYPIPCSMRWVGFWVCFWVWH